MGDGEIVNRLGVGVMRRDPYNLALITEGGAAQKFEEEGSRL